MLYGMFLITKLQALPFQHLRNDIFLSQNSTTDVYQGIEVVTVIYWRRMEIKRCLMRLDHVN